MALRLRTLLVLMVLGITASFVVFGGWLLLSLWDHEQQIPPVGKPPSLAIVRHLVEMHGGTVRAENNLAGRGATFHVVLPASTASPPDAGTV